ncbi:MAG: MFS transporter [Sphingobacteriales bacterium]|nr:MFS transporter [Sphingobacteriales bacterium]
MITRTIFILSLVSLFADIASEMLYPVMPLYLKHIGFSAIGLGLLEGLANATAALSKGYFGYWSDITQRRMPFVRWGYALSALSKPLTIISTATIWVLAVRTTDRLGKGIRTAPRDAILAAESAAHHRGTVFGFFHRAFTGRSIGTCLSLIFATSLPETIRTCVYHSSIAWFGIGVVHFRRPRRKCVY